MILGVKTKLLVTVLLQFHLLSFSNQRFRLCDAMSPARVTKLVYKIKRKLNAPKLGQRWNSQRRRIIGTS